MLITEHTLRNVNKLSSDYILPGSKVKLAQVLKFQEECIEINGDIISINIEI